MGRLILIVILLLLGACTAHAHERWANGGPVPPWVKSMCCGEADAHRLSSDDFSSSADGYHINGLDTVVPFSKVLPSQDGQWWAFWNENNGPGATIYCFFAPLGS